MQGNKMENLNFIWSECKCLSRKWEYSSLFVSSYSQVYNRYYYILEALKPLLIGLIFNRMALTLSYDTLSTFQQ